MPTLSEVLKDADVPVERLLETEIGVVPRSAADGLKVLITGSRSVCSPGSDIDQLELSISIEDWRKV